MPFGSSTVWGGWQLAHTSSSASRSMSPGRKFSRCSKPFWPFGAPNFSRASSKMSSAVWMALSPMVWMRTAKPSSAAPSTMVRMRSGSVTGAPHSPSCAALEYGSESQAVWVDDTPSKNCLRPGERSRSLSANSSRNFRARVRSSSAVGNMLMRTVRSPRSCSARYTSSRTKSPPGTARSDTSQTLVMT